MKNGVYSEFKVFAGNGNKPLAEEKRGNCTIKNVSFVGLSNIGYTFGIQ